MKVFAYVWQHWHLHCNMCEWDLATAHSFRLKEVSSTPMVFAPTVFLTGLRVFSVEIGINLLCADKSGRAGNIKTYREKSPWIIWNPVWMFHYIAAERLSRSCSCFFCYCLTHPFVLVFSSPSPLSFSLFLTFCDFFLSSLPVSLPLSLSFWC